VNRRVGYNKMNYNSNYNSEKGITLIELMITSVIILIVLSLGYFIYFFGMKNIELINLRAEIQQNARLVENLIRIELRNALKISSEDFQVPGNNEVKDELKMEDGKFWYGDSQFVDLKWISEIEFYVKDEDMGESEGKSKLLAYKIITENGIYDIENIVFLNNTSVPDGFYVSLASEGKLYYSKVKDSQ